MGGSVPGRGKRFFSTPKCPEGSGAHPVSYGSVFLGVKRPGHEAHHSPSSIPMVKNEESCTTSPLVCLYLEHAQFYPYMCVCVCIYICVCVMCISVLYIN